MRLSRAASMLAARDVQVTPLGRLVALVTNGRVVMLRADGSLFARTRLPTSTGNAAVIDTAARRRTIELTPLLERLGAAASGFSVYWSDQPPDF